MTTLRSASRSCPPLVNPRSRATLCSSVETCPKLRGIRITRIGGHCLSSSGCLLPKTEVCELASLTRIGVVLAVCAVAAPATAQGACTTSVTRASAVASIPPDYLALYQKWGSALRRALAAAGRGRLGRVAPRPRPRRVRPAHARRARPDAVPGRARTRRARRVDSAGDQGFGGTWGIWRRSSGHPPYRMDDPTTRSRQRRPRSPSMRARRTSGRARSGATTRCTPTARPCCAARRASA